MRTHNLSFQFPLLFKYYITDLCNYSSSTWEAYCNEMHGKVYAFYHNTWQILWCATKVKSHICRANHNPPPRNPYISSARTHLLRAISLTFPPCKHISSAWEALLNHSWQSRNNGKVMHTGNSRLFWVTYILRCNLSFSCFFFLGMGGCKMSDTCNARDLVGRL